ncbi:MAG TPA: hypothetical protein PKA00_18760, partial [Saprospiraceae bacterium]|nr:hypothetical protein [Saprospiraceae bacterium]HMQ84962.1 hypothetical protein [Saprospiraceae bacterium]
PRPIRSRPARIDPVGRANSAESGRREKLSFKPAIKSVTTAERIKFLPLPHNPFAGEQSKSKKMIPATLFLGGTK